MKRFWLLAVGVVGVLFILRSSSFAQKLAINTIPEKDSCFSVMTPESWKKEISEFPAVHPKTSKDMKLHKISFSPASKILIKFFEKLDTESSLQSLVEHLKKIYMDDDKFVVVFQPKTRSFEQNGLEFLLLQGEITWKRAVKEFPENTKHHLTIGYFSNKQCRYAIEIYDDITQPQYTDAIDKMLQSIAAATTTTEVSSQASEATSEISQDEKSKYSCFPKKTCKKMESCEEAYFQLKECRNKDIDRDEDGIPCESLCLK